MSFLLILFFLFIVSINCYFEEAKYIKKDFFETLYQFFVNITEKQVVEQSFHCFNESLNESVLAHMVENTGKFIGDLGNEKQCLDKENKFIYFLLKYSINFSNFDSDDIEERAMIFGNSKQELTGICLEKKYCSVFFRDWVFNEEKNTIFYDYLRKTYNMINPSFFVENTRRKSNKKEICFIILSAIIPALLFIMIFCSILKIFGYFFYKIDKIDNKFESTITLSKKDEDFFSNDSSKKDDLSSSFGDGVIFSVKNQTKNITPSGEVCKLKFLKIISKFDLFSNLSFLFTVKNEYYNDIGIQTFGFVRMIIMLSQVINYNVCTAMKTPGKGEFNGEFFQSIFFYLFVKTSNYCLVCWIILDGSIMSYKLFSFLTKFYMNKENNKKLPFWLILKFYLFSLPKFSIFSFCFFYVYVLSDNFGKFLKLGVLFEYFRENYIQVKSCCTNDEAFKIFIPFYYSYNEIEDFTFSSCYRYSIVLTNEFTCFIFATILIYISFRVRSKVYDVTIFALTFLNMGFNFPSFTEKHLKLGEKITFDIFLGSNYTEKFTHLFLNYYLIGVFTGISFFYYNDIISEYSFSQIEKKLPFSFCFQTMKFLDTNISSQSKKNILLFFLTFFLICIPLSSFIPTFVNSTFYYEISNFDIYHDKYSKQIFSILFSIVLIWFITFMKNSTTKHLIETNAFVIFERISTSFLCTSNIIVYAAFSIFHFQLRLNFQNLLFFSIGLMTIIILINIILTICIELAVRKLIKFLTGISCSNSNLSNSKNKIDNLYKDINNKE